MIGVVVGLFVAAIVGPGVSPAVCWHDVVPVAGSARPTTGLALHFYRERISLPTEAKGTIPGTDNPISTHTVSGRGAFNQGRQQFRDGCQPSRPDFSGNAGPIA